MDLIQANSQLLSPVRGWIEWRRTASRSRESQYASQLGQPRHHDTLLQCLITRDLLYDRAREWLSWLGVPGSPGRLYNYSALIVWASFLLTNLTTSDRLLLFACPSVTHFTTTSVRLLINSDSSVIPSIHAHFYPNLNKSISIQNVHVVRPTQDVYIVYSTQDVYIVYSTQDVLRVSCCQCYATSTAVFGMLK